MGSSGGREVRSSLFTRNPNCLEPFRNRPPPSVLRPPQCKVVKVSTRDRVARLMAELPQAAQYPTQGATVFVDLERREVQRGYTPLNVVRALLAGRGANMFYLHRLLDETRQPLDPGIPLIFGSGILTGIVPSAA